MPESYSFPAFRKYSNDKAYFKILSLNEFEELQIRGKTFSLHHYAAKILPDRVLIQDMLLCREAQWIVISEREYEQAKASCISTLKETDF